MGRHNAIDRDKLLLDVRREIGKGNNTIALLAQALKMNKQTMKQQLTWMVMEGHLSCKIVSKVGYYSLGYYPCNDPFNMTGRTYEFITQSDASP
jgi:hypothetical protein